MGYLIFVGAEGREMEHFSVKGRCLQLVLDNDFSNIFLAIIQLVKKS